MKFLYRIILIIEGLLPFISAGAQDITRLNVTHFTQKEGLGSINVRKILRDSKGFIWAGTQDGLYRFDGNHFQAYNKLLDKNHTISGSDIRDLAITNDTLWAISSFGGIDAINTTTGNVIFNWCQYVREELNEVFFSSFAVNNNKLYLGGSDGLYVFDITQGKISKVPLYDDSGNMFEDINISELCMSADKRLWLFTSNAGLIILNTEHLHVLAHTETQGIITYSTTFLLPNTLFAGTNKGLFEYTLEGKSIHETHIKIPEIPISGGEIYAVTLDKSNNIWFSSKNNLIKYKPVSSAYAIVFENKLVNDEKWTGSVFEIFIDNDETIWLGCQEGLAYSDQKPLKFTSFSKSFDSEDRINHCYSILPFSDTSAYVSAENGFYFVNTRTGSIHAIDNSKTYFFSFVGFDGNLIVSSIEGTFVFRSGKLIRASEFYKELSPYEPLVFNSQIAMGDSVYILGTQNEKGIVVWNYKSNKAQLISERSSGPRLSDNLVNTLYKSSSGVIWILTDKSVMLYDFVKNTIKNVIIKNSKNNKIYNIFFDMSETGHNYYLASYSNGIVVLDKKNNFVREISTEDGLSNNCVYRLFSFRDSLLLATTNNGLSVIDIAGNSIKKYYERSGLHSNSFEELSGNRRNENIYAGGKGGFTIISPENFSRQNTAPILYVNNIKIITNSGLIDTSNTELHSLKIPNNVLQATILFSVINYSNPEGTNILYRIKEQGEKWSAVSDNNTLPLIGFSHGTYHLQVQAFNEDGVPSDIKELTLIFLPKWYQTWWFKALIALTIISIGYALYRMRINQFKKEQRIRTKLASDLHDDLGSTMNSVKVYANLAIMEKQADKYLPMIKEGSQEAITGIRDIIWVLDDSKDSMEQLLSRISLFASPLCDANNIMYKQELSDHARDHKLKQEERRNLYMMLKEAVNNAIKYSHAQTITIEVSVKKGNPVIQIKDDGKGFDTGKINDGNGLKNMRRRAREIKYHFRIESSPGSGTTLHFEKI